MVALMYKVCACVNVWYAQLTIAGRDTFNIGIGTALPFNETALTLAPIPPWKYLGFDTDGQDRYEAYLEQLGRVRG